jgi:putative nucleotidyltransferase with HDIG domain
MTGTGSARILLLADEPGDSSKLQALLGEAAPDRTVFTATTQKEALAALEKHDFECVFCDLSAGPEVGAQFLQEIWKLRPRTVRFLLARSMTPDLMVTCALGANHFLQKPLDALTLGSALSRADAINQFVRNDRIQSLVSRMRTLPSRPSLYIDVMRELRSPTASATTVGELVAKDLAISTKLIQVVNSAFYGLSQQVTDPGAAVLLLGLETTASLVLSIEAFARFDKVKPIYFSMDRVWKHSQAVAASAKRIAELLSNDPDVARNAFTAGLLHDIGKLALALNFEEQYHGALKLAEKQKLSPVEVEAQVFGATHAETGAYLLAVWGLPLPIVEAVARHHAPASSLEKHFSATTALHIAERLEYAEDVARNNIKDVQIDLNYPPELEIAGRMEELRAIVRRDNDEKGAAKADPNEGTMIFTRAELRANPAPLSASGEPAPLVEVATPAPRQSESKKVAFLVIGCLSVALACAIGFVTKSQHTKMARLSAAQETEDAANPSDTKNQLSNLLVETSERAPRKSAASEAPPAPVVEDAFAKLKVQAIMYNGKKSSLVINGRSLRVGDEVDGVRIVAVQPNEVTLEKAGAQRVLRLQ